MARAAGRVCVSCGHRGCYASDRLSCALTPEVLCDLTFAFRGAAGGVPDVAICWRNGRPRWKPQPHGNVPGTLLEAPAVAHAGSGEFALAVRARTSAAHRKGTNVADLGCGRYFVPEWAPFDPGVGPPGRSIIGADLDPAALRAHPALDARLIASGEALPFASNTLDLVTVNMVLEHVSDPQLLFAEVFPGT